MLKLEELYEYEFLFNTYTLYKAVVDEWLTNKEEAENKYGKISEWDTRNVTNMSKLFKNGRKKIEGSGIIDTTNFNEDLSKWNVRLVKDMSYMFEGCSNFNSIL